MIYKTFRHHNHSKYRGLIHLDENWQQIRVITVLRSATRITPFLFVSLRIGIVSTSPDAVETIYVKKRANSNV